MDETFFILKKKICKKVKLEVNPKRCQMLIARCNVKYFIVSNTRSKGTTDAENEKVISFAKATIFVFKDTAKNKMKIDN